MSDISVSDSTIEPKALAATSTAESSILSIYGVVLAVGTCCGLAIVCVFEITKPLIARNHTAMRNAAILDVVEGAVMSVGYRFDESTGRFARSDSEADIFAGFDDSGTLVGFAIEACGMGYQDNIRILYCYDPRLEAIVGMRVLESRETPGLGDRIETDPNFISNFESLDVTVQGDVIAHPIEFVSAGQKDQAWQIDGITGATISSRATAVMIRESANGWIPKIHARRLQFSPEVP